MPGLVKIATVGWALVASYLITLIFVGDTCGADVQF